MAKHRAFTLLELIIVIGIILILAGISIPNFYKAKERSLGREAISNLKLIAAAERIYRMESPNNSYCACKCLCTGTGANCCDNPAEGCNYFLKLMLSPANWTYEVTTTGAPSFSAPANRIGGTCQYTLTDTDADGEPNGSSCP
jgi:prepilin-type N-terminal cleavage/methylation domain-containing protein